MNKTCMSYWLPKLEAAGLPMPRTKMVAMPEDAYSDIFRLFDGQEMRGDADRFIDEIRGAASEIGYPVFLRTGLTSGKHNWKNTCCFAKPELVVDHVASIVEFSECCSFMGLACDWWAVREFLPTLPLAVCPDYGDMPVCREFRVFVSDGYVSCMHPYWPQGALESGGIENSAEMAELLAQCSDEHTIRELASHAGAAVRGEWSVDLLETSRGWYITDMAEAEKSFHWPECEIRVA